MPRRRRWSSPTPVEPAAVDWEMSEAPDPSDYEARRPPADDSPETQAELQELRVLAANRSAEDVAQILHWSVEESSPGTHWHRIADDAIKAHGLTPPAGARVHCLLADAIYCAIIACWQQKWRHLRLRPSELDPAVDVSVIPVPQHPSYPAGHSTVAGAASAILSTLFPDQASRFAALAEESGLSRLKAGIHYRSDHTAGLRLGARVARKLLEEATESGAPRSYPSG